MIYLITILALLGAGLYGRKLAQTKAAAKKAKLEQAKFEEKVYLADQENRGYYLRAVLENTSAVDSSVFEPFTSTINGLSTRSSKERAIERLQDIFRLGFFYTKEGKAIPTFRIKEISIERSFG